MTLPPDEPADVLDMGEEPAPAASEEDMTPTEKANLAAFMTPEMLKVIGSKVVDRFNRDKDSRAPRMQQITRLQKMYALIHEKKSIPWNNCANVKTPSLTGPVLQIQARLYDMLWPPTGKVFNVVPATVEDQQTSHGAEQFANSYVRYKMPYMSQGISSVLHGKCLYGSAFRRTNWDAYEAKVISDTIPMDDFVVRFSMRSKDPSLTDVPRYTEVQHVSSYEIRQHAARSLYVQADMLKEGANQGERTEFREASDKIDGAASGDDDGDDDDYSIRQLLFQHCTMKLPNQPTKHPAFDGKEHYVHVLVDAWDGVVLRLQLREEDDPDDKRRFDREMAKIQADQMAAMRPPPPPPMAQDMSAPPMPGAMDSTMPGVAPAAMQPPSGQGAAPGSFVTPPMPMAMPPLDPRLLPRPARKRQIPFYTHYKCFESDGFYGLGYGDLLYGLVTATNTVINQWIDGMALKNAKPAFMSRQSRMARGTINIGPGQFNEIDVPMGSIKDAIMFLDPPQADPGTVPLIRMLDGMRDVIAGNSDLMSGQAPGSNQTKAGMQILNEQMMAPITVLARQTKEEFRHELDKIWRCWGVFLDDQDVADVISDTGQPQRIPIGKWMFTPSVHLVPASDPRMKSQRLEDLQGLTQFVMSMPPLVQNPQIGPALITKLAEMVFNVYPDGGSLIPMLHPPPPPPPQPMSQLEENVGFLRGQDHPVHPADNDDQHLAEIQAFMSGPEGQALDSKGKVMVENHHRMHIASRLQKRGQQFGNGNPQGNPFGLGPGGPPPMAGPPGIQAPPGVPPA